MKNLNTYIHEKLTIVHKSYNFAPQTKGELKKIIKDRLEKDPNADLNDIDVSNIIDMSRLFYHLDPHNIDISKWDVSNVENMNGMFEYCKNFNSDLSHWDVSNVRGMYCMFFSCQKLNSDFNEWDISKVEDMKGMFAGCYNLSESPEWYVEKYEHTI